MAADLHTLPLQKTWVGHPKIIKAFFGQLGLRAKRVRRRSQF